MGMIMIALRRILETRFRGSGGRRIFKCKYPEVRKAQRGYVKKEVT